MGMARYSGYLYLPYPESLDSRGACGSEINSCGTPTNAHTIHAAHSTRHIHSPQCLVPGSCRVRTGQYQVVGGSNPITHDAM